MRRNFDNTGLLVRFFLRRERVMSTVWIVLLVAFSAGLAPLLGNMFDAPARAALVNTVNNPAMIAMLGPIYGMDNYNAGAMYGNMMLQWVMITVAIMNILLVVRHTRGDEESGRAEMIRSLPTGRLATLNATMLLAFIVNVLLAILTGLFIAVCRVEGMSFHGAILYGTQLGVIGLFFAALTAIFSQLSSSSRGATGLSFGALAIIYLLRAAGDMGTEVLSYISPMGLIQRAQVFVKNIWWPVFAVLALTLLLVLIAYALNRVRDIDQGFLSAKPGKKEASAYLHSPYGLVFRLLRTNLIIWVAGMFLVGAAYASILGTIDEFVASSEFYSMVIGLNPNFTVAQMFVSMVTSIMTMIGIVPSLMTMLKLRSEEQCGRTEHILSHPVSRLTYMAGYAIMAFITSVLMQCAIALGIYFVASATLQDPGALTLGYLLNATCVYLPAVWIMLGITILLIGLLPRISGMIWGYFAFTCFVTFIGRIPDILPDWITKLTPLGYIPNLPADSIHYPTLIIMTLISILLTGIGFIFYRKRDLSMG